MRKSIFAALAVTGALVLGPAAAQATPVTPYHAGHDHGTKPEKPKPKPKKPKAGDHQHGGHEHGDHEHSGHHKGQQDDGAHASGGYDSHRSHPR
jgi:hypothetical protein